ncbi:putative FHA domain-containing protein [Nannochloris sp. 'desiccata']|nr:putative FHA domain-containing protein [Chlorella desiccata (nom. nud.)]
MPYSTPAFTLNITSGPLAGRQINNEGHRFRVGRTKASSIQIKDSAVSEKHAEIVLNNREWQIRDLGSSNGTMLNGKEVKEEFVTFKNGDELRFGTETITKVEIALPEKDDLTVQQFLEAECERMEQHIRSHAEQLGNSLRRSWQEEKSGLMLFA